MTRGIVSLCFVAVFLVFSAIPKVLNYQGKITDSEGIGITDNLDMTFRLFSGELEVTPLWEQTLTNVSVNRGLFSVELTAFPETLTFSAPYWLEVEIDGDIITGREKLTSSPYAFRAANVDEAVQSVFSSANPTRRYSSLMFAPGTGSTLSESDDSIIIVIGDAGSDQGFFNMQKQRW